MVTVITIDFLIILVSKVTNAYVVIEITCPLVAIIMSMCEKQFAVWICTILKLVALIKGGKLDFVSCYLFSHFFCLVKFSVKVL
jgi:hypothetical protein